MIPKTARSDIPISSYLYLKPEIRIYHIQVGITRYWDILSGQIWYHSIELTELNSIIFGLKKSIVLWPSYGPKNNERCFKFLQKFFFFLQKLIKIYRYLNQWNRQENDVQHTCLKQNARVRPHLLGCSVKHQPKKPKIG